MAEPVALSYGKDAVSVYRTDGERLFACEVRMLVRGEAFDASYVAGDNSMVIATDSMKNFIHRVALDYGGASLEDFLVEIGSRFVERYSYVEAVELHGREATFSERADRVLQRVYDDHGVADVFIYPDAERLERSGRERLHLIKLTGSSFARFVRDEYTTLPEMFDRPLFVHLDLSWHNVDYGRRADGEKIRDLAAATFAEFQSESIQHLVHEIGVRALDSFPEIDNIAFRAENRLWDAAQETNARLTVYTDARPPFGVITLSLDR